MTSKMLKKSTYLNAVKACVRLKIDISSVQFIICDKTMFYNNTTYNVKGMFVLPENYDRLDGIIDFDKKRYLILLSSELVENSIEFWVVLNHELRHLYQYINKTYDLKTTTKLTTNTFIQAFEVDAIAWSEYIVLDPNGMQLGLPDKLRKLVDANKERIKKQG